MGKYFLFDEDGCQVFAGSIELCLRISAMFEAAGVETTLAMGLPQKIDN
jgi:hypothetical protein